MSLLLTPSCEAERLKSWEDRWAVNRTLFQQPGGGGGGRVLGFRVLGF